MDKSLQQGTEGSDPRALRQGYQPHRQAHR